MDLTVTWAVIIAFAVAAYVVMDGFDLGIGILFPRFPVGKERDMAMNSIAPVWDGNETWLVMGGGGLLAAFPLAYAIVLPALYAPLIAFIIVYFAVFAAGTWYILRLMAHAPAEGEPEPAKLPIRTAGITPGPAVEEDEH